ncbi:hypothetical protein F8M41_013441 [Gigaspora margarita]|uniref:Uncharacterized protein n=1 Tax=Gigaspora margarita TaxID=4874 RepID=A0A8H3WYP0_GIGMA|nr:hypothetical protein F8M41_013441 [Gigaspora margarita]
MARGNFSRIVVTNMRKGLLDSKGSLGPKGEPEKKNLFTVCYPKQCAQIYTLGNSLRLSIGRLENNVFIPHYGGINSYFSILLIDGQSNLKPPMLPPDDLREWYTICFTY